MNTIKLGKPLSSSFNTKSLALMLIFSIIFVPRAVYTEIKIESNIVTIEYIHGPTNKNENIESAI